jgi:hypothetical protein
MRSASAVTAGDRGVPVLKGVRLGFPTTSSGCLAAAATGTGSASGASGRQARSAAEQTARSERVLCNHGSCLPPMLGGQAVSQLSRRAAGAGPTQCWVGLRRAAVAAGPSAAGVRLKAMLSGRVALRVGSRGAIERRMEAWKRRGLALEPNVH